MRTPLFLSREAWHELYPSNFGESPIFSNQEAVLCEDGPMDVNKILADLKQEKEHIEQAILVLQGLGQGQRRRGRKPAWMKQLGESEPAKRRGRPPGSKNKPADGE